MWFYNLVSALKVFFEGNLILISSTTNVSELIFLNLHPPCVQSFVDMSLAYLLRDSSCTSMIQGSDYDFQKLCSDSQANYAFCQLRCIWIKEYIPSHSKCLSLPYVKFSMGSWLLHYRMCTEFIILAHLKISYLKNSPVGFKCLFQSLVQNPTNLPFLPHELDIFHEPLSSFDFLWKLINLLNCYF